ncbi:MAG: hypothetical protein WA989_12960 [Henriciella sp.]|uniref:hypothetical protein n=1 Tax=Henriciella sp. TaxID=1968823 RepID=UPI003C748F46
MSFAPVQEAIGGPLLDMISSGKAARARLAEMSAEQRETHFWATVLNDTAYPLALGGFLAGLAARFGGNLRTFAVIPAFLAVITDLSENASQAVALQGEPAWLAAKTVLTPAKFGFFMLAAFVAVGLMLVSAAQWLLRRRKQQIR